MSTAQFSPPTGVMDVVLDVPGSKSVANRALICAMLADGVSNISGLPDGDDTQVIVQVLDQMGVIDVFDEFLTIRGNPLAVLPGIVDVALAGTSSRFLTAVAALSQSITLIDGAEPLRSRSMHDLHLALSDLGAVVEPLGEMGHLPVLVNGGDISGGTVAIKADVSSQFISALMLIGPCLNGGLVIEIDGEVVSGSYIAMTAKVMSKFGVDVVITNNRIEIPEMNYCGCDYVVEPDFSSAAFPIVALLLKGGSLRIRNLALAIQQGDSAILKIAEKIGASWSQIDNDIVLVCESNLFVSSLDLDMSDCSDLVPVVAVAMSQCVARGTINKVGFIRGKESDRLGDVATELKKLGVLITVTDDGLVIDGYGQKSSAVLHTHHDHRLAMSFALFALVDSSIQVGSPEVVSKSWPNYFKDMGDILGTVKVQN